MIGIIDYGLGNLFSVKNACCYLNIPAKIISSKQNIKDASGLILPGVGNFKEGMRQLEGQAYANIIKNRVESGVPILGICLGMQLLFTESDEGGITPGLDLISGKIRRFQGDVILPHVGWSRVTIPQKSPLTTNINDDYFYFVHSYRASECYPENVVGVTSYSDIFPSIVMRDNMFGVQFHPEKSSSKGLDLLKEFGRFLTWS